MFFKITDHFIWLVPGETPTYQTESHGGDAPIWWERLLGYFR